MSLPRKLALGFVFVWFMGGGLGHFLIADFFIRIVPPWVPWPEAAVYASGVLEILGAIGLLLAPVRRWAGLGLFLLTLCVTPANVHMWLHPELFPEFPVALLGPRLVLQVLLLAVIAWSTQTRDRRVLAAA